MQGAHRATGEGSKNGWQKAQRFSARQEAEVVLRLLRGEALDFFTLSVKENPLKQLFSTEEGEEKRRFHRI